MINRECKSICFAKVARLALIILGLAVAPLTARAQLVQTLIQFTNTWRYDQTGRDLTGTLWKTNSYVEDAFWQPLSRGLLGFEPDTPAVYTVHAPISTPLTVSSTVTSFYFRTVFAFSGSTNGLSLVASNLLDDGCVIYLNGFEEGRIRVPLNQTAATLASVGPVTEGQLDVVPLNASRLRQGANLLAVEVHQSSSTSVDVMWGMKLMAIRQVPLGITNQPQSKTILVGDTETLQVGVSGGPAYFQWQKNGANIPGATSNTFTIVNAQVAQSGDYRVVVTNAVSSVTSDVATLTVLLDITGPRLVSAVARDIDPTNAIILQFSERVPQNTAPGASSTNLANYRITACEGDGVVVVTNASAANNLVQLKVATSNWVFGNCYYVTVNNVTDVRGNRIAPDSQVVVSWPTHLNLLAADAPWSFHASAAFDPGVFSEDWTSTNYLEGHWWARGNDIFYGGLFPATSCLGEVQTQTGFQPEPTLFRTTFNWPTNLGSSASLQPSLSLDEGLVLYLNGVEIWRTNVPAATLSLDAATRTTLAATQLGCITNISINVTNLLPGTNWLAAGVVQAVNTGGDTLFGLRLGATVLVSDSLPEAPIPSLNVAPQGTEAVRLWWTGGGYALESTTNLTDDPGSYPNGPWQQITNMSNPYTNNLAPPSRFFRLKK